MKRYFGFALMCTLVGALASVDATADVMYVATGNITVLDGDTSLLPAGVAIGQPMTLELSLRAPGAFGTFPIQLPTGGISYNQTISSMRITIGGQLITIPQTSSSNFVSVVDNATDTPGVFRDAYSVGLDTFPGPGPYVDGSLQLLNESPTPTSLLTSDAYQLVPQNYLDFGVHVLGYSISLDSQGKDQAIVEATITSVQPVPLPASAWLLLCAVGALGVAAKAPLLRGNNRAAAGS